MLPVDTMTTIHHLHQLHEVDRARVTTHAFTNLLRAQCGEDIVPEVLFRENARANPVVARLLALKPDTMIHNRRTVLRTAGSGRVVTYAEAAVVLDRLSVAARQAILDGDTPLGDTLDVAHAQRELLSWAAGVTAPGPGQAYLAQASRPWSTLVTRCTLVKRHQPVALVTEWWPDADVRSS